MRRIHVVGFFLAVGAVLAAGCNTIKDVLPTEPTAQPSVKPTAALPALTIPIVLPAATPAPAPAPTLPPLPDPLPPPTSPTNPPASSSCSLPASNPSKVSCAKTSPQLLNKLEKAITAATQAHPEYFDLSDKKCDNCYKVKNETGYFNEVVRQLAALGVCAQPDADEIGLKATNDHSEWFDIYLGSGHIRRGEGAYLYGCNPANF
jgi:hypothetical protein